MYLPILDFFYWQSHSQKLYDVEDLRKYIFLLVNFLFYFYVLVFFSIF